MKVCISDDELHLHHRHPGYDVVFTSGATESFKIIAERFPWNLIQTRGECNCCCNNTNNKKKRKSIFMYATNSHNSVVGMRHLAMQHDAVFYACDMKDLERMTVQDFKDIEKKLLNDDDD